MRTYKRFKVAAIHFCLFILLIVFLIMSCGGSGGSDSNINPAGETAGVWNQMNWDEKNWQ